MTEPITDADLALLPAEYAWIGDRLKLTMNWSETSPNILLRLFIASQKELAELKEEIRACRSVNKHVQDGLLERICILETQSHD